MPRVSEPQQDQSNVLIESTLAQDQGTQMHYTLGHAVTVPKGHSLSVPFISTPLPSRLLAFYQLQVSAQHPLASLELQNASANAPPACAVTLYQDASSTNASFLGDANLAQVPAGEKRMLSFALDQKLAISPVEFTQVDQSKVRSSVEKSQLITFVPTIKTDRFAVRCAHDKAVELVVELSVTQSFKLVPGKAKPLGKANGRLRYAIEVVPGSNEAHEILHENLQTHAVSLRHVGVDQLQRALETAANEKSKETLAQLLTLHLAPSNATSKP